MADTPPASVKRSGRWVYLVAAAIFLGYAAWILGPYIRSVIVRDAAVTTWLHLATSPIDGSVALKPVAVGETVGADGIVVDLSATAAAPANKSEEQKETEGASAAVSVVVQGADTIGSRSSTFSGPRSLVLEISPAGEVAEAVSLKTQTIHSLLWHDGELWIGTGQEGKIYRWSDRRLTLEAILEDRQVASLVAGPAGAAAVTANASALYRLHQEAELDGTYTSSVLDAAQVARFGSFLWHGRLPAGAGLEAGFRSGMSSAPDATWTPWRTTGAVPCTGCGRGAGSEEASLADVAHGRYVQWRAKLTRKPEGAGPRLDRAELTYRQQNLRPKIDKLEALDPGQILVPASFNPQSQTFEPWSPNRDGIFTTLRVEQPKNGDGRFKKLWKKGYRTLQWSAKDDNADPLTYRLDFRRDSETDGWLRMAEEIDQTHYSFDTTVVPDGVYRFRLTASDGKARSAAEALADEKLSEAVVIDNSPPVLESLKRTGSTVTVELWDALSPMRRAAVSFDAGEWRPATAADGLFDGRRETLRIEVPDDTRLLLLRVSDAAHNVITFNLLAGPNSRVPGD